MTPEAPTTRTEFGTVALPQSIEEQLNCVAHSITARGALPWCPSFINASRRMAADHPRAQASNFLHTAMDKRTGKSVFGILRYHHRSFLRGASTVEHDPRND